MNIKRLLYILVFVPLGVFGQNVYIDPAGDDGTGDGSTGNPWFSVEYAMNQCSAGDTVFAKSGTYSYDNEQTVNVSGTSASYIVLTSEKGHPDSVVFDFWTYDVSGDAPQSITGISSLGDSCLKFEKFSIRRVWNINTNNGRAHGIGFHTCDNIDIEWVYIDSMAGRGIIGYNSGSVDIRNVDFTWCADPQDADPGNAGTGLLWYQTTASPTDTVRITGCRGWKCSDQGFGMVTGNVAIIDSCWSWDNDLRDEGYTFTSLSGFKLGLGENTDIDTTHVVLRRSISAFNGYGINENTSSGGYKYNFHCYNNIIYGGGIVGILATKYTYDEDNVNRYYNNIVFNNTGNDLQIQDSVSSHFYNSFDSPYTTPAYGSYFISPATVTTADFKALPSDADDCTTILGAARQSNGNLPDIGDYFKLASTSDLIDQGTVVKDERGNDLAYVGSAPDLGAFEYENPVPAEATVTLIALGSGSARKVIIQGNVTHDGGGTVSARGVAWDTSTNPDIGDDSYLASGSGTGTFTVTAIGLTPSTLYYFRTYATNEAGTAYSSNYTLTTPDKSATSNDNKWIINNGKIVKY